MNQKIVHVRLEYEEALNAKKDILSSELELIRIIKIMKRYSSLRNEEVRLKMRLRRKSSECLTEIRRIQKALPTLEIPQSVKRIEREVYHLTKTPKVTKEKKETNLEYELREIQNKLNSLQKR